MRITEKSLFLLFYNCVAVFRNILKIEFLSHLAISYHLVLYIEVSGIHIITVHRAWYTNNQVYFTNHKHINFCKRTSLWLQIHSNSRLEFRPISSDNTEKGGDDRCHTKILFITLLYCTLSELIIALTIV